MAKSAAATNTPTPEQVQSAVEKIEGCHEDLLSERGAYMQRCRTIREGITSAYDIAKDQGIPKKELRAHVKRRDLERKHAACRDDLEPDEQETFDMLGEKLGDYKTTPLGAAAMEAKKKGGETLDKLHS